MVVDTIAQAEFDFALHNITEKQQEKIAQRLKDMPYAPQDRKTGYLRIREIISGFEVAFIVALDNSELVILIVRVERAGELESSWEILARAGIESLPPGAKVLFEGRQKNDQISRNIRRVSCLSPSERTLQSLVSASQVISAMGLDIICPGEEPWNLTHVDEMVTEKLASARTIKAF